MKRKIIFLLSGFILLLDFQNVKAQLLDANGNLFSETQNRVIIYRDTFVDFSGQPNYELRSCAEPVVSDTTICSGNSVTVEASGSSGNYYWYDAATGGNLLTNSSTYSTPVLYDTTTYYVEAFCGNFYDGFEDGNVDEYSGVVNFSASTDVAYSGSWSGKIVSSCGSDHYCDAYLAFNSIQPTEVSYYVYPTTSSSTGQGYFVMKDGTATVDETNTIFFCYVYDGQYLRVIGSDGSGNDVYIDKSISLNQWYHVEIKDINWTTYTGDVYFDGVLYANDLKFRAYPNVTKIDRIYFYNFQDAVAYYDEVRIGERSNRVPLTVNVVPTPTADAGSDITSCGVTPVSLDGTAANYSSILWTTSGSGTFDDATAEDPVYTPSQSDLANGSVTLTMTAYGISPCSEVSDDMILTLNPPVELSVNVDTSICGTVDFAVQASINNYTTIQWTTSGTGTFDDAAAVSPVYTPSQDDYNNGSVTISVTVGGEQSCQDATESFVLSFVPTPTADAGSDITSCGVSPVSLDGTAANYSSILWATSGSGTFDDATAEDPVYTPSQSDLANGSVTLTMTVYGISPCSEVSDDMILTLNPPVELSVNGDTTICTGNDFAVQAAINNYTTIQWTTSGTGTFDDATAVSPVYTPSQDDYNNGSVTISVTVGGEQSCQDATASFVLSFYEQASVSHDTTDTICSNGAYHIIASATNYDTLYWSSSGDGVFDDNTLVAPQYTPGQQDIANGEVLLTLTLISAGGCDTIISTLHLYVSEYTTVDCGPDIDICSYENAHLNASVTGNQQIVWRTNGDGTFSDSTILNPVYVPGTNDIQNGMVILYASGDTSIAGACPMPEDSVVVYIHPAVSITDIMVSDVNSCDYPDGSIHISTAGGTPPLVFSIDGGNTLSTDSVFDNLSEGFYNILVTDNYGCKDSGTATINGPEPVVIDSVAVTNPLCYGDSNGVIIIYATNATQYSLNNGYSYIDTNVFSGLASGMYYIRVKNENNCFDTTTVTLIEPEQLTVDGQITDNKCCCEEQGEIELNINGGTPPYYASWSTGDTGLILNGLAAGNYSATVSDENGCDVSGIFTVSEPDSLYSEVSISYENGMGDVEIQTYGGTPTYVYLWNDGYTEPVRQETTEGEYVVIVTDNNGCNDTVSFSVEEVLPVVIPNVLTPNNDGSNDYWKLQNIENYVDVEISVYNRWGDKVYYFSGNGANYNDEGMYWDGTYNGKMLPFGEYLYVIKINETLYKGTVLIK